MIRNGEYVIWLSKIVYYVRFKKILLTYIYVTEYRLRLHGSNTQKTQTHWLAVIVCAKDAATTLTEIVLLIKRHSYLN